MDDVTAAPGVPVGRSGAVRNASVSQAATAIGMAIAFAFTFLFRWLTVDFTNDHFTHLAHCIFQSHEN